MAARISWSATDALPIRGRCDDHRRLEIESEDKGNESALASRDVRTLIANQPGVDVKPCDGWSALHRSSSGWV